MRQLLVAVVLIAATASAPVAGGAQPREVSLNGRVQWVAGQTLMLMLDGGGSVNVDLTQVPLDTYTRLRERDRVVVIGVLASDNRQVLATSVTPVPSQPPPSRTP